VNGYPKDCSNENPLTDPLCFGILARKTPTTARKSPS